MAETRSPFTRGRAANGRTYGELGTPDCDISFVSSPWPSNDQRISIDRPSYERPSYERPSYERPSYERASYERPSLDMMDFGLGSRLSNGSEVDRMSIGSLSDRRSIDQNGLADTYSSSSGFSASSVGTVQYGKIIYSLVMKNKLYSFN